MLLKQILLICLTSAISIWLILLQYGSKSYMVELNEITLEISEVQSQKLIRNKAIAEPSQVKCLPKSFGVSDIEDTSFFPKRLAYFGCNKSYNEVTVINKEIVFECNKYNESFIFGEDTPQEIFGSYRLSLAKKPRSEYNDSIEWFYAKCGRSVSAYLENKFNLTAAQQARSIQEKLHLESKKLDKPRPLAVLMLMIDSVSRQSVFRNLKKTIEFLNDYLIKPNSYFGQEFVLYDFLINNAQG